MQTNGPPTQLTIGLQIGGKPAFIACFGAGVAPVSWQTNEFLPMEVRAVGTMLIVCTCWGTNIIVASTFLSMMHAITPSGTFGFYAGLCALGWVLAWLVYPEYVDLVSEFELCANSLSYYTGSLKCHSKKYALFSSTALVLSMQGSGRRTIRGFSMPSDRRERSDQRGLMYEGWDDWAIITCALFCRIQIYVYCYPRLKHCYQFVDKAIIIMSFAFVPEAVEEQLQSSLQSTQTNP